MALGKNLSRKKDSLFPEKKEEEVKPKLKAAKPAKKKSVKTVKPFQISGEITISNVQKTYEDLKIALDKVETLEVNIEDVVKYDLSFIQLLHSLKQEKKIRLKVVKMETAKMEHLGFNSIV